MREELKQETEVVEASASALRCLDSLAAHFRKPDGIWREIAQNTTAEDYASKPELVWQKLAQSLIEELSLFNASAARAVCEAGEEWHNVTLHDLQTACRQQIKEMEAEEYVPLTSVYREALFLGRLIGKAIAQMEEREGLIRLESQVVQDKVHAKPDVYAPLATLAHGQSRTLA